MFDRSVAALGAAVVLALATAGPAQVVRGRVVDVGGQPIEGVAVVAVDEAARRTTTAADGAFTLELATFDVRGVAWLELSGARLATARVPVWRGAPAGDVAMVGGAVLVGEVVDPRGRPVADAEVEARDALTLGSPWYPQSRAPAPHHLARARTGPDGRFRIDGALPEHVAVVAHADRFEDGRALPVDAIAPARVVVRPRVERRGVALSAGRPVAGARVTVHVPGLDRPERTGTDAAGRFVLWLPESATAALEIEAGDGSARVAASRTVDPSAWDGLRVELARPGAAPGPGDGALVVVDADSGAPLDAFAWSVVPHTQIPLQASRWQREQLRDAVPACTALPELRSAVRARSIHVQAPGHSRKTVWFEPGDLEDGEIRIALGREVAVTGHVVDPSGAAVADARIAAVESWLWEHELAVAERAAPIWSCEDMLAAECRAAPDGSFAVRSLGVGDWTLVAWHPTRPDAVTARIAIGADGAPDDVALTLPDAARVRVELPGAPAGSAVRLWPCDPGGGIPPQVLDRGAPAWPLGPDGAVDVDGVSRRLHRVELLLPGVPPRCGPPRGVLLRRVEPRGATTRAPIRPDNALPTALQGRIRLVGDVPPIERIVVVAEPLPGRHPPSTKLRLNGPAARVARDGTFALSCPRGAHTLLAVDARTGVVLGRGPLVQVPDVGEDARLEFEVRARRVDVVLRGFERATEVPAALELDAPELWPVDAVALVRIVGDSGPRFVRGIGLPIGPTTERVPLWLPVVDAELWLFTAPDDFWSDTPVPSRAITFAAGRGERLELAFDAR